MGLAKVFVICCKRVVLYLGETCVGENSGLTLRSALRLLK